MSTSSSTPAVSSDVAELKDMAAAANFNQANSGYRPPMVSNQIRPPGFPPIQNPMKKVKTIIIQSEEIISIKTADTILTKVRFIDLLSNQPVAHRNTTCSSDTRVSKTDFERYVTANDAVLRNMQNQGQNLQSQMANLTDMLSKFVTANTASTSGSGTLPGNTITNPKEDLKDASANNESTEDVPTSFCQVPVSVIQILSPVLLPLLLLHALIDVYEGEITLRVGKEAITFNLDQTSRYTADCNHMTVNKVDVIDMACDEYSQEVLGFSNVIASGNLTPILSLLFQLFSKSHSLSGSDPEGDILLLEAILNSEPPPPLPNQEQYLPGVRKELKLCEAKTVESSVDEPPEGVNPEYYTQTIILIGRGLTNHLQSHRRVHQNPRRYQKELKNSLDAGLIYTISDTEEEPLCIVNTDHSAIKYLFAKKDAKGKTQAVDFLLLQEFDKKF
ncbi:hypothetical protein Tco_0707349 [Tanacetum coccineum]|uniref:Reverse transcriptase domain-containing protein n=1 Tax=Tanacetum coccineum TaxID=301880 RepID=A0ABQ4YC93_9ASTR